MSSLLTIGQVARRLGEPQHRVEYVVKARCISPAGRVAHLRVFDDAGFAAIRHELRLIDQRREAMKS